MKRFVAVLMCLTLFAACVTVDERAIKRLNARGVAEPTGAQIAAEIEQIEADRDRREAAAIELATRLVADLERELGKAKTEALRRKTAMELERICNFAQEAILAAILLGADVDRVAALERRLEIAKEVFQVAAGVAD